MSGSNCPRRVIVQGVIVLGGNCPGELSGGNCPGVIVLGVIVLGGNCPGVIVLGG